MLLLFIQSPISSHLSFTLKHFSEKYIFQKSVNYYLSSEHKTSDPVQKEWKDLILYLSFRALQVYNI